MAGMLNVVSYGVSCTLGPIPKNGSEYMENAFKFSSNDVLNAGVSAGLAIMDVRLDAVIEKYSTIRNTPASQITLTSNLSSRKKVRMFV